MAMIQYLIIIYVTFQIPNLAVVEHFLSLLTWRNFILLFTLFLETRKVSKSPFGHLGICKSLSMYPSDSRKVQYFTFIESEGYIEGDLQLILLRGSEVAGTIVRFLWWWCWGSIVPEEVFWGYIAGIISLRWNYGTPMFSVIYHLKLGFQKLGNVLQACSIHFFGKGILNRYIISAVWKWNTSCYIRLNFDRINVNLRYFCNFGNTSGPPWNSIALSISVWFRHWNYL